MKNELDRNIEIAYFILQNKYIQQKMGKRLSEKEILNSINDIFPEDWTIKYNIKSRIKILGQAIKENRDIREITEKGINK